MRSTLKILIVLLLSGSALAQDPTFWGLNGVGGSSPPTIVFAALPSSWEDNNRATDGVNCGGYCSGQGFTAPAYELQIGTSTGSWVTGPPAGCTFTLANYVTTSTGLQDAITDVEACRTYGIAHSVKDCIVLDVPPTSSQSGGFYTSTNGIYFPQTSSTPATCFNIVRSTMDSTIAALPEPVCAGGVQDNLATSVNPGLINPDCAGDALAYQLGTTVTTISSGAFTFANGTASNTSNYNYAQYLWQVQATGTNPIPIQFCSPVTTGQGIGACASTTIGPDHWLLEDFAVAMNVGNTTDNDLLNTGILCASCSVAPITSTSQFASYIDLRRGWAHGDWTSLTAGANSISQAFSLAACIHCTLIGSQVSQALRPGTEGHAVDPNGTNLKIDNNWLEGQSSCAFAGGFPYVAGPPILNYVPFQNSEFRRNRCTFPYAWLGQLTIPGGNTNWSGHSIVRKNAEELKSGIAVLFDGDIFESSDNSGGQSGTISNMNIRNCSGAGTYCQDYAAIIKNLTISNTIYRNACEGFGFAARSGSDPADGGGVSYASTNLTLYNILHYNITSGNPGCPTSHFGIDFSSEYQQWQGTISGNGTTSTFVGKCAQRTGGCIGQVSGATITNPGTVCTPATGGTITLSYPAASSTPNGGTPAKADYTCTGGTILATVTFSDGNYGSWYVDAPTVSAFSGTCTGCAITFTVNASSTTQPPAGFEVFDISTGQPVAISGCTSNAGFNQPGSIEEHYWTPSGVGPNASSGSAAWTGTYNSAGVTISYPWTTNGSDSAGYCTLTNVEGSPQWMWLNHLTYISDAIQAIGNGNAINAGGPNYQANHAFRDSIILSNQQSGSSAGWYNSAVAEGTATEQFNYDYTSMTADNLVWPTRTSSKYTAYGNNSLVHTASPNMYFPASDFCSGSTYSGSGSNCVAFTGAMSASSMPLVLNDYHGYELRSDSPYWHAASDGTDIGANIPAIDSAQILNVYVCHISCGSPGPFPDH